MPQRVTSAPFRGECSLLLLGGWACLVTGLWLLRLGLDLEMILIPPFFLAALALGVAAILRTSRIGGMLLLLCTVAAPVLILLGRGARSTFEEQQAIHAPAPRRGAPRPPPRAASGFPERIDAAGPEAGNAPGSEGKAPAGSKARRPLPRTQTGDARAGPPDAPPQNPVRRLPPARSAAQIPAGLPQWEATVSVPSQRPPPPAARAGGGGATPDRGPAYEARGFPEDPRANLPFVVREVEDVLDKPLAKESQTNAGVQVGGTLMYTDETNMYGKAWVRNGGTGTLEAVQLLVFWFDTNANILATSRATVKTPGGIEGGRTLDFGIRTPGDPRIAAYHYVIVP